MNRVFTPTNGKTSHGRQQRRQDLLAAGPSPLLRSIIFTAVLGSAVSAGIFAFNLNRAADAGSAVGLTGLVLVVFYTFTARKKTRREHAASLLRDFSTGCLLGAAIVGVSYTISLFSHHETVVQDSESSNPVPDANPPRTTLVASSKANQASSIIASKAKEQSQKQAAYVSQIECVARDSQHLDLRLKLPGNEYLQDLPKSSLRILSAKSELVRFELLRFPGRREALPASIVLLIDDSASRELNTQVSDAVSRLARTARYAKYRVCTFGETFRQLTPWTRTTSAIEAATRKLNNTSGEVLVDALVSSVQSLSEHRGERLLIAFIGQDHAALSEPHFDVAALCIEHDVRVFTVHLSEKSSLSPWLRKLSTDTGAQSFSKPQPERIQAEVVQHITRFAPTSFGIELLQEPVHWPIHIQFASGQNSSEVTVHRPNESRRR